MQDDIDNGTVLVSAAHITATPAGTDPSAAVVGSTNAVTVPLGQHPALSVQVLLDHAVVTRGGKFVANKGRAFVVPVRTVVFLHGNMQPGCLLH